MLAVYLVSLLVGGVLIALSIAAGADHGGDHAGVAHGADHGAGHAEAGQAGGQGVLLGWLPLGSLRFWIFFAAFFGLTGAAMTGLALAGALPVAAAAAAVGYASGLLLTRTIRHLERSSGDSSVAEADLVGATARVLLPIAAGRTGKVRVHIKGRSVDLLADTEEDGTMAAGEDVLVIAAPHGGRVVVARAGKLD
jgi:membrane protein implicated in regulation of membrane protease activity